jgi:hypothetical protein
MAGPLGNLFQKVWEGTEHIFAAEGRGKVPESDARSLGHPKRTSPDILNQYPVEVLIVDDWTGMSQVNDRYWTKWLDKCQTENLPDYVFVATGPQELILEDGLQSKGWQRCYL